MIPRLLLIPVLLLPLATQAKETETQRLRAQVQSLQAQLKALQAQCPTAGDAAAAPPVAASPVPPGTPTPTMPAMSPSVPLPSPAARAAVPVTQTPATPAAATPAATPPPSTPAATLPAPASDAAAPPVPPPGYKLVKIDPKAPPELPHDDRFRSQANWESLFRGMSETEVEELLGIEHRTLTKNGRTLWSYGVPGLSPVGRVIFVDGKVTVWELPNF